MSRKLSRSSQLLPAWTGSVPSSSGDLSDDLIRSDAANETPLDLELELDLGASDARTGRPRGRVGGTGARERIGSARTVAGTPPGTGASPVTGPNSSASPRSSTSAGPVTGPNSAAGLPARPAPQQGPTGGTPWSLQEQELYDTGDLDLLSDSGPVMQDATGGLDSSETIPPVPGKRRSGGSRYRGGLRTSQDEDFFAPGTLLEDKFEVQHKIGQGAMGMVYLARDRTLKRDVAVKTLSSAFHDEELIGQFREEAESMARVQHPNVVQIFSYGEEMGVPYFVMELVDGESLADAIDRRELDGEFVSLDEALGIISQVCRGLSAIHAKGIVHRDIKPANIMITTAYRVALTDFGLVGRIADEKEKGMEVHGTPVYLAPERIDTRPVLAEHSHLCDIYALGIVLYEFLTHQVPFDHDSLMTLLTMHLNDPPPRPSKFRPDLPPAIEEVILRALAKDPAERYESAEAFRRALLDARESGVGAGVPGASIDEITAVVITASPQDTLHQIRAVKKAYPGATVVTVTEGVTGLEFIRELRPDLVLMDAECRKMNALELVASLQGEDLLEGTQILVLSETADRLEQQYLKDLGVADVLKKPVSGKALARAIRAVRIGKL